MKIVDIVPKDGEDKTSEVVTGMYRKGRNVLHCEMQCQDRKSLPDYDGWCSTFRAPWAPFMVFSGKSYEKIVQEKDPGNRENGAHGAQSLILVGRIKIDG